MVRAANERTTSFCVACVAWLLFSIVLVASDLGVLAFVGTIFFLIFMFGLRDKFSNEETASAYSVFNRNQQSITGSLTADQLDRQLRGGFSAGAVGSSRSNDNSIPTATASGRSNTSTRQSRSIDNDERLRRRTAAALAAERRLHSEQS